MTVSSLTDYFEEYDDEKDIILGPKKTKYLTITFTREYQKFIYKEIFKKINKDINRNYVKIKFELNYNVPLNILVNIRNLFLAIRYQKFI